ncbi:diphosphomevalonate/mevalonate 3,5-bisphosphate decarboxylase family protein [Mesonia maritima]|uniref:Diphosphomevalonate decarboxylase n=1 Tax=Mesonia maritima TaxID=1793873 RepID=A0ABU1K4N1_9FLAO|nr:diphosphomevalonate decarboxylase [Mesonia maritima]MDR6300549.1 diphosphomevalonate decarboxylase [Mesonia maritima]
MTLADFIPKQPIKTPSKGKVTWQSPSNIALVKYWGKYGEQLPKNTSLSFTLNNCVTTTTLIYKEKKEKNKFDFKVFLDGKRAENFEPKIKTFFQRIEKYVPFLKEFEFEIHTENSFPHSSGIASSASGMSALALCLLSIEKEATDLDEEFFRRKASFLARLGSGSAARSIEGPLVLWGEHKKIQNSSNLFGSVLDSEIHEKFATYQDTILLVDKGEKKVSSSVGHNLMHNHPFAEQRFKQAQENISTLIKILKEGNLEKFIKLVESESLTLHAMMMSSNPYFILMKPNTLEIINKIWNYRADTNSKLCFTLDAGANVHLLYPENEKTKVLDFIKSQLVAHCQNEQYICDKVGSGAKQIFDRS